MCLEELKMSNTVLLQLLVVQLDQYSKYDKSNHIIITNYWICITQIKIKTITYCRNQYSINQ